MVISKFRTIQSTIKGFLRALSTGQMKVAERMDCLSFRRRIDIVCLDELKLPPTTSNATK